MKNTNIFEKILFVGMNYKEPKGGIASVLNTYSTFISPFKFIRTSGSDLNTIQKIWYAFTGYLLLLRKLFTDNKIEIVHIHSASGSSFWRKSLVIRLAKLNKKKIIFHCHGGGFKKFREKSPSKIDSVLKKVDCIVCLSQEWREYFESIGFKNTIIIKNLIPNPKIEKISKDGYVHFLFLGLICDNKGIFDVIKTIADHKKELEGKMILHIGGNGETERLKSIIKNLDLEKTVKFEGWVDRNKKENLLNLTDVYILPSYMEGVPISILEAESYQKAVIASGVGGIPSIVKDHESGLLITPGNYDEIFSAMKTLINNEDIRNKYGEIGYKISLDYSPEKIKEELIKLYVNILSYQKAKLK